MYFLKSWSAAATKAHKTIDFRMPTFVPSSPMPPIKWLSADLGSHMRVILGCQVHSTPYRSGTSLQYWAGFEWKLGNPNG